MRVFKEHNMVALWWNRTGKPLEGLRLRIHERAAGQQISGMTEKRQEAQKSSTRPEEGELEIEMGFGQTSRRPTNR